MRIGTSVISGCFRKIAGQAARLASARRGNVALTFGLLSLPLLLGVGSSIDYVRAYNVKVKMQSDLDAALIAAVKQVDSLDEALIEAKVVDWFDAQKDSNAASYSLSDSTITVSKVDRTIQAVATGHVPTTFMGLANISNIDVSAVASVSGPATSYLNVYLVLDKSASMLLAATTDGQTKMMTYATSNCVFACHVSEGQSKPYNGVTYSTNYALSKAMGVKLRADVSVTAAKEVVDLVTAADPTQSRIKVGLYTIGADATEVLAPTVSMTTVKTTLDNDAKKMNSATSESTSYFNTSLATLNTLIGTAGDGSSASTPLKLVLMLTDGVQSERDWVVYNPTKTWICAVKDQSPCLKYRTKDFPRQTKTSPLNPNWCQAMKTGGVTLGVLYTEYLSIDYDWGYNGTVGDTMKSSSFTSLWGGTLHAGVSNTTSRRDYIPYSLKDCATSEELFLSASDPDEIEEGLASLFQAYVGSVRLTQ